MPNRQTTMLFILLLGFAMFPASFLSGGKLATLYGLNQGLFLILIGNILLGLYAAALGYIGATKRLNTHQLIEQTFGKQLGRVVALTLAVTQVGWFGVGVAMFAQTVEAVLAAPHVLVVTISTGLMISSAWFGIRAMSIISVLAVPAMISLLGFSIWQSFTSLPTLDVAATTGLLSPTQWMTGILVVVGSFISGATFTSDYIHHINKPSQGLKIALWAFFIGNTITFLAGFLGAKVTGQPDVVQILLSQGLTFAAVGLLSLSIWTTNDNALYTCSLAVSQFTPLSRRTAVIVVGVLAAMSADWLFAHMIGWLSTLSLLIPPIGSLLILDHFLGHKIRPFFAPAMKKVKT